MAKFPLPPGNFFVSNFRDRPKIDVFNLFRTLTAAFPIYRWTIDYNSNPMLVFVTLELIDETNGSVIQVVANGVTLNGLAFLISLNVCGNDVQCLASDGKTTESLFLVNTSNLVPSINQVAFIDPLPSGDHGFCRSRLMKPGFPPLSNRPSCCSCSC